ncbi:MAG: hypothetical protein GC191_15785 [Azospirillum sp.]|nr:hypothetical protein [Azospirillum sp.]
MRALKVTLLLGAVIIAVGFVAIGLEVYKRFTDPASYANKPRIATDAPLRLGLGFEEGARVEQLMAAGGRLAMLVRQPGGGDRVVVLDVQSGTVVAVVAPGAAPASPARPGP